MKVPLNLYWFQELRKPFPVNIIRGWKETMWDSGDYHTFLAQLVFKTGRATVAIISNNLVANVQDPRLFPMLVLLRPKSFFKCQPMKVVRRRRRRKRENTHTHIHSHTHTHTEFQFAPNIWLNISIYKILGDIRLNTGGKSLKSVKLYS